MHITRVATTTLRDEPGGDGSAPMIAETQSLESVTVVVAQSRPLLLRGLEHICSEAPGFEVVATCARADATLEAIRNRKPDVVILSANLPPSGGLWVLKQMRREKLPTRAVLLLTDHEKKRHLLHAVRLGVEGILHPDMTPESLLRCVRTVHEGEPWLESPTVSRLLNRRPRPEVPLRQFRSALTPRQMEIVRLATEAIPTREIAARLMLTEGTVKVHLHNIYEKLRVDGRVGLVLLVMQARRSVVGSATPALSPSDTAEGRAVHPPEASRRPRAGDS
jgi:two-component system nitrate/nitrite response regulator NarL